MKHKKEPYPSFLIRKADNLYDFCYNSNHKGIFLVVNQFDSPIIYWSGRSETCRAFVATKIKGIMSQFKESYEKSARSSEKVKTAKAYRDCPPLIQNLHEEIFDKLQEGEKGVFSIFIDDNPRGYGYYFNVQDPFSQSSIQLTLDKFIKDAEL